MMRISDRTLLRWLHTGRPRRVDRQLDDPDLTARLDAMTALDSEHVEALTVVLSPPIDLTDRLVEQLDRRADGSALGLVIDLCGLAWHTASAVLDPDQEINPDIDR